MAREPSVETERAMERKPSPDAPDETAVGSGPGEDEERRLADEQAEATAGGRTRDGYIVLRTPMRRAIFIGGLLGLVVIALIVAMVA